MVYFSINVLRVDEIVFLMFMFNRVFLVRILVVKYMFKNSFEIMSKWENEFF